MHFEQPLRCSYAVPQIFYAVATFGTPDERRMHALFCFGVSFLAKAVYGSL
jgi:hypothetical protein